MNIQITRPLGSVHSPCGFRNFVPGEHFDCGRQTLSYDGTDDVVRFLNLNTGEVEEFALDATEPTLIRRID